MDTLEPRQFQQMLLTAHSELSPTCQLSIPIRKIFVSQNIFLRADAVAHVRLARGVRFKSMATLLLRDGTHIPEDDVRDCFLGLTWATDNAKLELSENSAYHHARNRKSWLYKYQSPPWVYSMAIDEYRGAHADADGRAKVYLVSARHRKRIRYSQIIQLAALQ